MDSVKKQKDQLELLLTAYGISQPRVRRALMAYLEKNQNPPSANGRVQSSKRISTPAQLSFWDEPLAPTKDQPTKVKKRAA